MHTLSQNLNDETPEPLFKNLSAFEESIRGLWAKDEFPKPKQFDLLVRTLGDRDETADPLIDEKSETLPDPELRDFENVPLKEAIDAYFDREVRPFITDAWINREVRDEKDGSVGIVGYDIPFTRYFYEYQTPPSLSDIEEQIVKIEERIQGMLKGALS